MKSIKQAAIGLLVGMGAFATPSFAGIGLQGGLNFESASTPAEISSSTNSGVSVGVNFRLPIVDFFAIQPELMYNRRGVTLLRGTEAKLTATYDSLTIPVLASFGYGEKIRPTLFVGPAVTFNLSRRLEGAVGNSVTSISFNPRTVEYSAIVGAGVEFGALFANLRYQAGLADLSSNSADFRSQGFQLLVGLQL